VFCVKSVCSIVTPWTMSSKLKTPSSSKSNTRNKTRLLKKKCMLIQEKEWLQWFVCFSFYSSFWWKLMLLEQRLQELLQTSEMLWIWFQIIRSLLVFVSCNCTWNVASQCLHQPFLVLVLELGKKRPYENMAFLEQHKQLSASVIFPAIVRSWISNLRGVEVAILINVEHRKDEELMDSETVTLIS